MRIVTRGDVDGLMCAVLLKAAGIADEMVQAHPKDVQDGKLAVTDQDVICNLPYVEGCGMWFDHHSSEELDTRRPPGRFIGHYAMAPSAARLVYEYFRGEHHELERFSGLLEVVDRFDSAELTRDDVERPSPEMLLAFLVDPRTGLGYHHGYRISNRELTQQLPDMLLQHSAAELLQTPDFQERIARYEELEAAATELYRARSRVDGNVVVTDLRGLSELPPANRFLIYTLPGMEAVDVSVRVSDVRGGEVVSIQVGHNIFNRTNPVAVGPLMAEYGGGGHRGAGACQVPAADADRVLGEIVGRLRASAA